MSPRLHPIGDVVLSRRAHTLIDSVAAAAENYKPPETMRDNVFPIMAG
jgi:hypothetical protein